jgi:hypothetical protein
VAPREPLDAGALVAGDLRERARRAGPVVLLVLLLGLLLGRRRR